MRCSKSALAHGWYGTGSGLISAAISRTNLLALGDHTPDRSGLPPAKRGAGAERFGLPSLVRGIASGGTLVHCAQRGIDIKNRIVRSVISGDPQLSRRRLSRTH